MATVAVMHIGLGGHLGPANRLGAVLARQGHRVLAWAPEAYRGQIEATGAHFRAHEPVSTRAPFDGLVGFAAKLAEATDSCSEELIEQLFEHDVELVVHDCHVPWARVAGDFLGLPRVVSNPLFPQYERLGSLVGPSSAEALARVEASRHSIARRWGVELGDWHGAMVSTGEATVSYTTKKIVGTNELAAGWRYVGPLMDVAPPREPAGPRPLVYVALGTFFNMRAEAFRAAIDGLAGEQVDVLVSTGQGIVSPSQLEPLPPNVVVREFVRSREVLARASVHVTHGGCSSVHESLLAGVPMVCIPQGGDQSAWSWRTEALGAGQVVEMTAAAIRSGVRRLLEDDRPRRRAHKLGQWLARYDGEAKVAELVERVLAGRAPRRKLSA